MERPRAIQVTLETLPPRPTLEEMVPVFRKVLGVKPLLLEEHLSEEELPNDGPAGHARQTTW